MKTRAFFLYLAFTACASSETAPSSPSDGGTTEPEPFDSGAARDASSSSDSGTPSTDASDAGKDADASSAKPGSCAAPRAVTLPFSEPSGSTSGALDGTSVACGAPASLPEAVYRVVLANDTAVKITANDESGQGIGIQVREDSCTGTSVECTWQANGSYGKTLPLPAGTWLFIVERNPAGAFSFELEAL